MARLKDKERILKAAREKQAVTCKGPPIRLSSGFSTEIFQARKDWHGIFKVMISKDLQPRLLYPARLSFKIEVKYCDPSYFVLLSQSCCCYSGSFMVPYKFLKCLFYICEICHWYFNRDCTESINCFG